MVDFCNPACFHRVMKADLRISIKDFRRHKLLRIQLSRTTVVRRSGARVSAMQLGRNPAGACTTVVRRKDHR